MKSNDLNKKLERPIRDLDSDIDFEFAKCFPDTFTPQVEVPEEGEKEVESMPENTQDEEKAEIHKKFCQLQKSQNMSPKPYHGISPKQYHAGVSKLWDAIDIYNVLGEDGYNKDIFTLAVERIKNLEDLLNNIAAGGTSLHDLLSVGENRCQSCGRTYETIYRVPNEVWTKIAPQPETLGKHIEHQFGGLLCMSCADSRALEAGIVLYWDSNAGDWLANERLKEDRVKK